MCVSIVKKKYSNIFFYETPGPIVLKFHMEYDQTAGFQTYKIGLGRGAKVASITKNNKINFFFKTTWYIWLNFGIEH